MEQRRPRPLDDAARGSHPVLVTGACGLVGRATVTRLLQDGRDVIATDLRSPATEKIAAAWGSSPHLRVEWCDLTRDDDVTALLTRCAPSAVIHLAAVIPPLCYSRPELARAVNVDATDHLLRAASSLPRLPRFVMASSVAVYGARNPTLHHDVLDAATPMTPTDLYGALKAESELHVRESALDWVVLRLGGVMTVEPASGLDLDMVHFASLLPVDGRIQTVDVRDVARAFAAATTADVVGEILLIAGDDATHRLLQGDVTPSLTGAQGLAGAIPVGRRGDPDDDTTWFATDWMDTTRAQEALDFQRHRWPDMLEEIRVRTGLKRYAHRLAAPILHEVLRRTNARRGTAAPFAPPPARHRKESVADA